MTGAETRAAGQVLTCEEGCGCRFERKNAFALSIDAEDHFFCCSDCADAYQGRLETPTVGILREHVRPGQTVADLGCGSGYYTFLLADLVGPEGSVIAVDRDPGLVRQLREVLAKRRTAGNVRVRASPAERLRGIAAGTVDFILSNNVLCCTDLRSESMGEIARVLRPGGVAYLRASKILTKGARPISDPEWDALLSSFVSLHRGADASVHWAIVQRGEPPHSLQEGDLARGGAAGVQSPSTIGAASSRTSMP